MYLRSNDPLPFCQVRCGVTVDKRRAALASAIESLSLAGAAEPQDPRPPELRALALAMAGDLCAAESALAGARRLRTSGSGSFADGLAALLHAAAGRSQSALRVAELLRARAPAEATWLLLLCGKLELAVGGGAAPALVDFFDAVCASSAVPPRALRAVVEEAQVLTLSRDRANARTAAHRGIAGSRARTGPAGAYRRVVLAHPRDGAGLRDAPIRNLDCHHRRLPPRIDAW
jgi:hypothetical protein